MNKIGIPQDNMLLVNAGRIRALILEEKALDIVNSFDHYSQEPYRSMCDDDSIMLILFANIYLA